MPNIQEFYPSQYGAFESAYSGESRILGIGNNTGCKKPICSKTKIVFKGLKPTRVPNMACTQKFEAYNQCLATGGIIDLGSDDSEQEQEEQAPAPKEKPTVVYSTPEEVSGFEFTTPIIIGIAAGVIILIISIILILNAASKPAAAAKA